MTSCMHTHRGANSSAASSTCARSDLLSRLLESQEADRRADLNVGEDAGRFAWEDEKWGDVALLPASATSVAEAGRDWLQFFLAVGAILSALSVLCECPSPSRAALAS